MYRFHRLLGLAVVAMITLLLSGCSMGVPPRPRTTPVPLPGDQLVFTVQAAGGLTPPLNVALSTPTIAVYGDGRVIAYDSAQTAEQVPLAYQISQVGPDAVAQFAADAETTGVVDSDTDFGDPTVTDMPVTTITFHGSTSEQVVHVYAFSDDFENGLSRAQRKARRDLRQIVDQAFALPGDTTRKSYQPDQIRITELSPFNDSRPGPA